MPPECLNVATERRSDAAERTKHAPGSWKHFPPCSEQYEHARPPKVFSRAFAHLRGGPSGKLQEAHGLEEQSGSILSVTRHKRMGH